MTAVAIERTDLPAVSPRRTQTYAEYHQQVGGTVFDTLSTMLPDLDRMFLEDLSEFVTVDLRRAGLLKRPRARRGETTDRCIQCDRPMVPKGTKNKPEGTFYHAGFNVCTGCYNYEERPRKRTVVPENCLGCGRKFRGCRVRAEDAPGTIRHRTGGRCKTCCKNRVG